MAKATLLMDFRAAQGELLVQMVLWQIPRPTKDRPHGLNIASIWVARARRLFAMTTKRAREIIATLEPAKRKFHTNFDRWRSC
jgi:hypothetical protein